MKWMLAAAIAVAVAGIAVFTLGRGPAGQEAPDRRIAMGAALYAENCASCHGANLEGEPDWKTRNEDGTLRAPPHDESGHTWHHSDAHLLAYTKLGGDGVMKGEGGFVSGMPAFGDVLTDDEIGAIFDFIKSRWSDDVRLAQSQMSR